MRSGLYAPRPAEFTPMKIAAYLIEKIGSTVSGYFHPSLWLSESHGLLVTQGHQRIDARRAPRGQETRQEGKESQSGNCSDQHHRVGWFQAKEHCSGGLSNGHAQNGTENQPRCKEQSGLAEHQ